MAVTDKGAEELRWVPIDEDAELDRWRGPDGNKSKGFGKYPPKPGLATDADDAGRVAGPEMVTDLYGNPIVLKPR